MYTCKRCNKEFEIDWRKDTSLIKRQPIPSYCSRFCANSHSRTEESKERTKQALKKFHLTTPKSKTAKVKICKICGQSICQRSDICKKRQTFKKLSKYFGFDLSKIGTILVYEEFDRVVNLLKEEYFDNKLSSIAIAEKYGHKNKLDFNTFLKRFFDIRNLSDATRNNIIENGLGCRGSNQYKSGHHTTWNNRDIFYRSSYELEYAQQLDLQRVDYVVERLRILYWDSQRQIQRVAVPDFYLLESNTIVEIKSSYTYNEQNMKDKRRSYIQHGYNFKFFLDKKEVDTSLW
ncbi:MAG: hypothetical protein WC905_02470 [Patescibacteria group bacterium]|jgi:hypothetical protein